MRNGSRIEIVIIIIKGYACVNLPARFNQFQTAPDFMIHICLNIKGANHDDVYFGCIAEGLRSFWLYNNMVCFL